MGDIDIAWVRAEGDRLRRWGQWGDDDGRGALNLLTADRVLRAVQSVETGHGILSPTESSKATGERP